MKKRLHGFVQCGFNTRLWFDRVLSQKEKKREEKRREEKIKGDAMWRWGKAEDGGGW